MTTDLHERLTDLAGTAVPRGLDIGSLRREAARRTGHARLAAAAAVLIVAGAMAGGLTAWHSSRPGALQTAGAPRAAGPVVPGEQRLREVLHSARPPAQTGEVRFCCDGPIRRPDSTHPGPPPYTTLPFGRDDRTATYPELFALRTTADDVQVNWTVVNPPMTDTEADDLARGVSPPDPNPIPVPDSQRLVDNRKLPLRSVVYARDGQLIASAWSKDGGYVTVSAAGPPDARRATWLNAIARDLITPVRDSPTPSDDPELGTMATPEGYRMKATHPGLSPVPDRVDLLARYRAGDTMLLAIGHVADGRYCVMQYDDKMNPPVSGAMECGPTSGLAAPARSAVGVGRSFSSNGGPLSYTIYGTAPAGTRTVVVTRPDRSGREVRAIVYDSGQRWQHLGFFYLPWQAGPAVVTALDSEGRELATGTTPG